MCARVDRRRWRIGLVITWIALLCSVLPFEVNADEPATAEELVAQLVGENLPESSQMHVILRTPPREAARALVLMKDDAVPALSDGLGSDDELQRLNVVFVLGRIGTPATVPVRVRAMGDASAAVRALAVSNLPVWTDDAAMLAAREALEDLQPSVRNAAIGAFSLDRYPRPAQTPSGSRRYAVAKVIVALLEDPDTRCQAARTLGSLGMNVAARPLAAAMSDDRKAVRHECLEAIGKLADRQVTPEVLELLTHDDAHTRAKVAYVLGQLRDIRATIHLSAALTDDEFFVRREAAGALGAIGDRRATPALVEALWDEEQVVRRAATKALGQIGDPAALDSLVTLLVPGDEAASDAATALGELGDPAAIEALRRYLMELPESRAAAEALGRISHPASVRALIAVAIERNSSACKIAVRPLLGRDFRSEPPEIIELWWNANERYYTDEGDH